MAKSWMSGDGNTEQTMLSVCDTQMFWNNRARLFCWRSNYGFDVVKSYILGFGAYLHRHFYNTFAQLHMRRHSQTSEWENVKHKNWPQFQVTHQVLT